MEPTVQQPSGLVRAFITAQNAADVDGCLNLVADDAVFDVGRGRYEGKEQIASFLRMLIQRGSQTNIAEERVAGDTVTGLWEQADDDGRRMGVEKVILNADVTLRAGKIAELRARPTPESLAALRAAAEGRADLTPEASRALGEQPPRA